MRRGSVAWRDPRQVAGDLAVEHEGIKAVAAPHVAADIADEVCRDRRQINGGITAGSRGRAAAAGGDVVVPKDELVGTEQPDPIGSGALDAVIGDPHRLSSERLAEDGLGARGHEPVAAEAYRRARHPAAEAD